MALAHACDSRARRSAPPPGARAPGAGNGAATSTHTRLGPGGGTTPVRSRSRHSCCQTLAVVRDAIDKFFADRGRYPLTLEELAEKRYLRRVPPDPITDSATTWVIVPPPDVETREGVYDVRSGAPGNSIDGEAYESW